MILFTGGLPGPGGCLILGGVWSRGGAWSHGGLVLGGAWSGRGVSGPRGCLVGRVWSRGVPGLGGLVPVRFLLEYILVESYSCMGDSVLFV